MSALGRQVVMALRFPEVIKGPLFEGPCLVPNSMQNDGLLGFGTITLAIIGAPTILFMM